MNMELSEAAKADRRQLRLTYEKAYTLFLNKLEVVTTPEKYPLPYGICDEVKSRRWPYMQITELVSGDLSETINQLNAWREWLLHLSVWTDVVNEISDSEDDAWTIQGCYVDPLAQICLMQPSAVRDRFGHIATHAIHQANMCTINGYKDHLKQDEQPQPLSRKQLEKQLPDIGQHWSETPKFISALQSLDGKIYRQATLNYRNLASHAIAPRFRFGVTRMVVRSIGPATERVTQPDGTCSYVENPNKKAISYGFGGTDALDLSKIYSISLDEYQKATDVFEAYSRLLREIISSLPTKSTS